MERLKYYIAGGVVVIVLGGGIFVYLLLQLVSNGGLSSLQRGSSNSTSTPTAPIEVTPIVPMVHLWKGSAKSLLISCENLPEGTYTIKVYRAKLHTDQWILWKVKQFFPGCDSKVIEIKVVSADELYLYKYYFEAVSEDGEVLWKSNEETPSNPPPGVGPNSPPPTNEPPSPSSTVPGTPPSSGGGPTSSSTPPGGGPTTGGGPTAPPGTICYTPNGTPIGPCDAPKENFWVQHIDKKIEIGWQNIPPATDEVFVYRSTSTNGPWELLLDQNSPADSYIIRLVDNTVGVDYFYKMDARQNGHLLQSYGPVFLEAITP